MDSQSSSNSISSFPPRFKHAQPISDRILRALRHRLLLLHRSDSSFFILGATGNVYTVTLSSFPSCSCPDRTSPCKHILFVFIRVLGLSLDDVCLRRRSIRPCHLRRLLTTPTSPDSVAGASLRERFHQLFFSQRHGSSGSEGTSSGSSIIEVEDGSGCPICLEEMGKEDNVVACATCRNPIHEDCLVKWKRSRGRRLASCVICRARWRDTTTRNNHDHQDHNNNKYLNLSAYVTQDDVHNMPHTANSGDRDGSGPSCTA